MLRSVPGSGARATRLLASLTRGSYSVPMAQPTHPQGFDSDPKLSFLKYIGLRIGPISPEQAVCEIELRDDLRNRGGMLQGGITATLVDVAGGLAGAAAAQVDRVLTADMNIHYLAPARVGPVRATGAVLRAGRRTVVVEVRVLDVGADERLVAVGTVTMAVVGG